MGEESMRTEQLGLGGEREEPGSVFGRADLAPEGAADGQATDCKKDYVEPAHASLHGPERLHLSKEGVESQAEQRLDGPIRPRRSTAGEAERGLGQNRGANDGSLNEVTEEPEASACESGESPRLYGGKRKSPEPDSSAVPEDSAKVRLQRRLIKNRRTAAASRERKQQELLTLTTKVQGLEADNTGLRQALWQRDAEVRVLRAQVHSMLRPPQPPLLPQPQPPGHGGYTGSTVLRPGFPAWPPPSAPMPFGQPPAGPGQAPRDDAGGPRQGEPSGGPWLPEGQPLAPGPLAGSGGFAAPWPSLLPDGWPRNESLGSSMLPGAAATEGPLALGLQSLSASGLSSQGQFGVIRGLDGQYLRLASFSSQSGPRLPPIANLPWADNQQLQARSSSCSALPGGPAVAPAGGAPEGQPLLRWRSGSYPPDQQLHLPAHAHVRQLVSLGSSAPRNLPPLPHDVHGLDPLDFEGLPLWADLE
ncbi:hypothetical protein COCSUDRAFT_60316 [Coccomyxa subellipsoidea C-169]|uniref:BZIP domain-containing protein n=1 Tax=Coccomyxa subellipsoidea (strain C-169) TaxID=574566 RepID=I0YIX9_COCSC|nr:hypothetical protein COCSUDRAFT_60316 [Coccomyxa subellipsoidea C-169]EIE18348.1 hypothetical protein COCSUDRAFT_60316 [Coccomyxa subellipsoidea C-169]|eukprot:XP_005642892.1 hypothetical protein COCSUDRAFT_60316 [Coccomyxa subellipsoidea C-169]